MTLYFQQVLHRENAAEGFEGEVQVVHNHPFLTLLDAETLDVRKHGDWNDDFTAIGQEGCHKAALHAEVQFLYTQICVLIFAHMSKLSWLKALAVLTGRLAKMLGAVAAEV